MSRARISIRTYILVCVLLGAIGMPWAWRNLQSRRAVKVAELQTQLAAVRMKHLEQVATAYNCSGIDPRKGKYPPAATAESTRCRQRIHDLESRLEKLTGTRPNQRDWEIAQARDDLKGVEYVEGLDCFIIRGPNYLLPRRKLAIKRLWDWGLLKHLQPPQSGRATPALTQRWSQ